MNRENNDVVETEEGGTEEVYTGLGAVIPRTIDDTQDDGADTEEVDEDA